MPRPFSPPVVRLTVSTHAQEYGFCSTHSTNAVSLAILLAHQVIARLGWESSLTLPMLALLSVYASSVLLGRIYCGMHSVVGSLHLARFSIMHTFLKRQRANLSRRRDRKRTRNRRRGLSNSVQPPN